jgi:predicted negative regulator of RcsB-dependent stress response
MNITTWSTTELALIIALAIIAVTGIVAWLFFRKRRTEKLRTKFGGTEYALAVEEGGSRRRAEAGLKERTERVESLKIRALAPGQ